MMAMRRSNHFRRSVCGLALCILFSIFQLFQNPFFESENSFWYRLLPGDSDADGPMERKIKSFFALLVGGILSFLLILPFGLVGISAIIQIRVMDKGLRKTLAFYEQDGEIVFGQLDQEEEVHNGMYRFWVEYTTKNRDHVRKKMAVDEQEKEKLLAHTSIQLGKVSSLVLSAVPLSQLDALGKELNETNNHRKRNHYCASAYLLTLYLFFLWGWATFFFVPELMLIPFLMVSTLLPIPLVYQYMQKRNERRMNDMLYSGSYCTIVDTAVAVIDMVNNDVSDAEVRARATHSQ